jgi:hypothetical protein
VLPFFLTIWSLFNVGGHSFPNVCDPQTNDVISFGWNVGSNSAPLDPAKPAWMMTFESWYEPLCGGDHLHEWHIQWRGTNGVGRRPLTVSVNPEKASGAVGIFGDLHVSNNAGVPLLQVTNGTVWTHGAVTRVQPDQPALSGWDGTKAVEAVRVTSNGEVVLGRTASGIRIGSGPAPVVASCDDLITFFADKGVIVDGR